MIEPTNYLKKLEGKSNSHLITFNDGRDYVIKYFQQGFEKTLPNEWISYCLGRYLGLPIPFAQIVNIPQEYASQIPELTQMDSTPYQFASIYIPDCLDGHQVSSLSKITNHSSLASVIVFDYWLYNGDRTRKNILLHAESENAYRLWAIDQAEVFGTYNWVQSDLEQLPSDLIKSATHQIMASFIENKNDFFEQLELIQTIPVFLIEEIVAMIPDEWGVSKEEKKVMVQVLVTRRKKILPEVLKRFVNKIYLPLHNRQS